MRHQAQVRRETSPGTRHTTEEFQDHLPAVCTLIQLTEWPIFEDDVQCVGAEPHIRKPCFGAKLDWAPSPHEGLTSHPVNGARDAEYLTHSHHTEF